MTIRFIQEDFIEKVSEKIRIIPDGNDRFRVFTPFRFDDGDHITVVLKKERTGWVLSDEGYTYMHLTYDISEKKLFSGTRYQIISNALDTFNVEDRYGELVFKVKDARFGDALYSFAQALIRMGDVLCLSKGYVHTTFIDDFQSMLNEHVPDSRIDSNWHSKELDSQGKYTVDCRINGMSAPLFVYALSNDDRIRDATIALQKFLSWDLEFSPIGIFKDRDNTNSRVRARFDDVCEVQFPNMQVNHNEIIDYITKRI